jgi:flagellar biosynthetic protein FliQ
MTQVMVLDIIRNGLLTIIKVSMPILLISLVVGLIISILQAVTQVQEQTLSFVPKIVAVMLGLIIFGNFMLNSLISLFQSLFRLIGTIV